MIINKNRSSKRIGFIIPYLLPAAGLEILTIGLIKEFVRNGLEVDLILVNEANEVDPNLLPGVNIINLRRNRLIKALLPISKLIRQKKYDGMYVAMWPLTVIAVVAKLISFQPLKLIISDHNLLSFQYDYFSKLRKFLMFLSIYLFYPFASKHVSVSEDVRRDFLENYMLGGKNLVVINNLVHLEINKNSNLITKKSDLIDYEGKVILTVGRFKKQKNFEFLIQSFATLLKDQDCCLVMVGAGEELERIKSLVKEKSIESRVFFTGHQTNVSQYYEIADVFALTSHAEGFGNVIIEALHHGIPVVSTNCPGGPKEIITQNIHGLLVNDFNYNDFAKALSRVLNGEIDFKTSALKSRANDFTPERIGRQYLQLIE